MEKLTVNDLKKVESSNIDLVGFNDGNTYIVFKNGNLYEYPNTTLEEYSSLANAESVGEHFFKSYKAKTEFNLLEDKMLVKAKESKTLIERISDRIITCKKEDLNNEAAALVLLKAALIDNTKAKKPIKDDLVAKKYFKSLQKQQEEYLKLGISTRHVAFEMSSVEPFTPKEPKKMEDSDIEAAVKQYIGTKGFTQKDMGAIVRYMIIALGVQNSKSIAKFIKESLNG